MSKTITLRLPAELKRRVEKQSKKEKRSVSDFIRRVLDRYLLEQEFRGTSGTSGSDVAVAAQQSINKNRKLLEL
jgi:Arc/MetJ-type ribon-helix-helix transcriptional regulator